MEAFQCAERSISMQKFLTGQFVQAIDGCYTLNEEKIAKWQICRETSYQNVRNLAEEFGTYISEYFSVDTPDFSVDHDVILAFLNLKTDDCSDDTLIKKMSGIRKLERCFKYVFPEEDLIWNTAKVIIPKSTKITDFAKDKPIPLDVSKTVIPELLKKRSEVGHGPLLSTYLGLRVGETVCLKVEDICLSGGDLGFGYVTIKAGDEGGAKNKMGRIVPVLDQEAQDALKSVISGKKPGDYVVAKKPDKYGSTQMTPGYVCSALSDVLTKNFGDTYKYNGCHGMRKTWAQRLYDEFRKLYTREIVIIKTSEALGHQPPYGEENLASYVPNIH